MSDRFGPMSTEAQREQRLAHRQFLAERDGRPDVAARTLSHREGRLQRFLSPRLAPRELDRSLFDAQYARLVPARATPREALLILTLVKVKAAEAYGVNSSFPAALRRAEALEDDLELILLIEETYHTKILLSSALLYGITVDAPYTPPPSLRLLIAGIERAPQAIARPLTLAAEILGTVAFLSLLHATREIVSADPELRDAVEERLTDVLIDEIGHISFNRMCLEKSGLERARSLVPWVARGLSGAIPEFGALGLTLTSRGVEELLSPARLPESVREAAFIAYLLDAVYQPTPVPDPTGRTRYVDNPRLGAAAGGEYAWPLASGELVLGVRAEVHGLLARTTLELSRSTALGDGNATSDVVLDEVPDDATAGGAPLAGREGLQTNNPGWPGFASSGWVLGGSLSASYRY